MNSKQRAYLRKMSAELEPIFHIGKSSVTPEITSAIEEALIARELIKLNVLKNCPNDTREIAEMIAERTRSEVVLVIGRKFVLYKKNPNEKKSKFDI